MLSIIDLMTRDPITVREDQRILDVVPLYKEKSIHHIPVVDQQGDVVGMLSSKDVENFVTLTRLIEEEGPDVLVQEIMTQPIFSFYDDVSIQQAALAMVDNRIHAIIVADRNTEKMIGIVTSTDVLKHVAGQKP
ncbi:MAG: CBS domain-containing protein [Leptospiraceae bacterium]|nr:CBS domain-containing protein [Leptospiraceae bacterium]